MWLSTNLCSRKLSQLAHPECPWVCHGIKDPPQQLLAASCSTSRFHSPSFDSPSLCHSTFYTPLSQFDLLISSFVWISCLSLSCSHPSLVVLCVVCCDEPEAAMHVRRPPEAWLLVRRMNKCGTPLSSSPSSHQSPFSLSHLPLLVFTPLFPISLSMYLSLTLSACRLWEWCVMLGEWGLWRNRDIAPGQIQPYYLFSWCVCVCVCVCVFVLLNGGWVNGWLFVFTLVKEYVGCLCLLHLSVPIWGNKNLCVCTGWVVRCGSAVCEDGALHTWTLQRWRGAKHNRTGQNMGAGNTSTSQTTRDLKKHRILGNATRFYEMEMKRNKNTRFKKTQDRKTQQKSRI